MSRIRNNTRARRVFAVLAGLAVTAAVVASAASLGGLSARRIGSESTVVADAADGVEIIWGDPSYDPVLGGYVLSDLTLDNANPAQPFPLVAAGAQVKVALTGAGGAVLAESAAVSGGGDAYAVSFATPVAVEAITGASVVIAE